MQGRFGQDRPGPGFPRRSECPVVSDRSDLFPVVVEETGQSRPKTQTRTATRQLRQPPVCR